jgi:hypothetical protein
VPPSNVTGPEVTKAHGKFQQLHTGPLLVGTEGNQSTPPLYETWFREAHKGFKAAKRHSHSGRLIKPPVRNAENAKVMLQRCSYSW